MSRTLFEDYFAALGKRQLMAAAEQFGDVAGAKKARAEYEAIMDAVEAEGEMYCRVFHWFDYSRDAGNIGLDINAYLLNVEIPDLVACLKASGVKRFTFSSRWQAAIETAWAFMQNGCHLEGMTEVKRNYIDEATGKNEIGHGYLFRIGEEENQ